MGFALTGVEEGSQVVLHISHADKKMDMNAIINKVVKENLVLIEPDYPKKVTFDNVVVDMEYIFEGIMPIFWRNVKIVYHKSRYYLHAPTEGVRHNRREYYRVGVGMYVQFRRPGHGVQQILLRDISVTGFSITDNSKQLGFKNEDMITVKFADLGFEFELKGKVVRSEELDGKIIYGLELCNLCKGLSAYVNAKQRQKSGTSTNRNLEMGKN